MFGDGTGPMGQGPMTGRGAGYCAGYDGPGYANPISRRGVGFGRGGVGLPRYGGGRGRGYRNWYRATGLPGWQRAYPPVQPTAKEEKEMIKEEKEILQEEMNALKERMKALENRFKELNKKK